MLDEQRGEDRGWKQLTLQYRRNQISPSWAIVSMDKNGIIHTAYDGGQLGSQLADLHGEISSNRPEPVP